MDINVFNGGLDLAFRIRELQKDVAAFLKHNYSSTDALPIFSAESALHKTVSKAVYTAFGEMMKTHPKVRQMAEQDLPKEMIDEILKESESQSADVNFDPIK